MSSFDLEWDHQFCLACDKQTDGATYCSESCRLADYEKNSATSSGANSPALSGPSYPWGYSNNQTTTSSSSKFYLTPAYDFSSQRARSSPSAPNRALSPSSSQSSLCSLRSSSSTATTAEASQLSAKARKELRDYASSFEQAKLQRRRSY